MVSLWYYSKSMDIVEFVPVSYYLLNLLTKIFHEVLVAMGFFPAGEITFVRIFRLACAILLEAHGLLQKQENKLPQKNPLHKKW